MLFKKSQNQKKVIQMLVEITGDNFNIFEKVKHKAYGSPKYLILELNPTKFDIDFSAYTDLVYASIELRKKGIAIYFRHKNEEYIVASRYNQTSFISNDGILQIQLDNHTLKMAVKDINGHSRFLAKYMEMRNYDAS